MTSPRLERVGVASVVGQYEEGVLSGRGKLVMRDGSVREGWFQHGYCHGPFRGGLGTLELNFIGHYRAGLPSGVVWTKQPGGGWLVGEVDSCGRYSGPDIAFLFPDLRTAVAGEWREGELVRGRAATLDTVQLRDGVMVPRFRHTSDRELRHWPSTREDMHCPLDWRDPYEEQWLEVRQSEIPGPHSGDGAFAVRDIPPNTTIAFYNGIRMKQDERTPYEDTGYAIWVEFQKTSQHSKKVGEHMDLPPRYHSYAAYSATSAHKLNHSFTPNCSWSNIWHPCLGLVPCVVSLDWVRAGAELTVHYLMDMETAPDWYMEAWARHGHAS